MPTSEEPINSNGEAANGQHANGHAENGRSENGRGLDELIQEAESLRTSLMELGGRLNQLLGNLKRYRKRGRAVEAALSALRLKLPALP